MCVNGDPNGEVRITAKAEKTRHTPCTVDVKAVSACDSPAEEPDERNKNPSDSDE